MDYYFCSKNYLLPAAVLYIVQDTHKFHLIVLPKGPLIFFHTSPVSYPALDNVQ